MFKKSVLTVLVLGLMVGVGYAGGVTDDNNGNKGNIFVSTGENHGANSVGEWVDPSELGLKGEKGDTGATGATGPAGRDGLDGLNGSDGQDGQNGLDGRDGVDGAVGPQGDTGETGQSGINGQDGQTPIKGVDYNDGKDGKDVDPSTVEKLQNSIQQNTNETNKLNEQVNKLEETQNIIGGVIRIKDTKKWSVDLFIDYSTNRQMIDRQGIRFTYKMGESYQDKENKRLEARIKVLEEK